MGVLILAGIHSFLDPRGIGSIRKEPGSGGGGRALNEVERRMRKRNETPRIGGRTRRLEEPRGIGAWALVALTVLTTAAAVLLALAGTSSAEAARAAGASAPAQEAWTVWLVRHAEKVDDSRDPELSPAGRDRALLLADRLADEGIGTVHTTDYLRTRHTARPLAERLGLEPVLYDPRALEAFAAELKEAGGVHLVVGHSNTTPALVEALGGDPVSPIDEAEYDRLYRVWLGEDGTVRSELERFGVSVQGG